jgi:hypothetical protein
MNSVSLIDYFHSDIIQLSVLYLLSTQHKILISIHMFVSFIINSSYFIFIKYQFFVLIFYPVIQVIEFSFMLLLINLQVAIFIVTNHFSC